ncbi:MAG: PorV/PorQ family protein [Candidatus Neomarinimicrobiota bacterium]
MTFIEQILHKTIPYRFPEKSCNLSGVKWLILYFSILTLSNPAFSQFAINVSKVGTTSAPFLEIGVGSRAIGMGSAFVAVADDATALYWNVAGLSRLTRNEMILIHSEWIADISYDFVGGAFPLSGFGTIGISITSLSTDEMKVRTVDKPEGTGEKFSVGDLAMGVAYAKNLTDRFSIGLNVKYIRQKIWHMSATGFAADIGTLFTTQFAGMKIGMSISNFGGKMRMLGKDTFVNYDLAPTQEGSNDRIPANLRTDEFPLPLLFRVGLAMDVLKSRSNHLTIAIDAAHPNDNTEYVNLGLEYALNNWLFLRAGYKNLFMLDNEEGLALGAGLKYKINRAVSMKFDYGYQDFGRLINAQRLSLALEF